MFSLVAVGPQFWTAEGLLTAVITTGPADIPSLTPLLSTRPPHTQTVWFSPRTGAACATHCIGVDGWVCVLRYSGLEAPAEAVERNAAHEAASRATGIRRARTDRKTDMRRPPFHDMVDRHTEGRRCVVRQ